VSPPSAAPWAFTPMSLQLLYHQLLLCLPISESLQGTLLMLSLHFDLCVNSFLSLSVRIPFICIPPGRLSFVSLFPSWGGQKSQRSSHLPRATPCGMERPMWTQVVPSVMLFHLLCRSKGRHFQPWWPSEDSYLVIYLFSYLVMYWGLNLGYCACESGALPFESGPQP
jgi:hypothetical protein